MLAELLENYLELIPSTPAILLFTFLVLLKLFIPLFDQILFLKVFLRTVLLEPLYSVFFFRVGFCNRCISFDLLEAEAGGQGYYEHYTAVDAVSIVQSDSVFDLYGDCGAHQASKLRDQLCICTV